MSRARFHHPNLRLPARLGLLILMLGLALPLNAQTTPTLADYGDAPDALPALYSPPFQNVTGNFPTDFVTTNSRYGLPGGHTTSSQAWLGGVVSLELGARDCTDPDTIENLVDDDFDDGVVGSLCPFNTVPPFGDPMLVNLTVDVGLAANATNTVRFINVVLDQNHDGTWNDATSSLNEWVVQDFPVALVPGTTTRVTVGPFLVAATSAGSWMRVALTDQTISSVVPVDTTGWDGSGVFNDGEMEDYLLSHSLGAVLVAEHAEAAARATADALSIAYIEAQAEVEVIVDACVDVDLAVDSISVSCSSADAAVVSASTSSSNAQASAASAATACAGAATTANAVSSTCVTCECASACANASASALSMAAACGTASSSAGASANAAASAFAAAQASADACALAYAHAEAYALACADARARAEAEVAALAVAYADAQAQAQAAANALAAAYAAACNGDTAAAALAATQASAAAQASVDVFTLALVSIRISLEAEASVLVYVQAAVEADTLAATSASAAAGASTSASSSATASADADASAAAIALSLSQALASTQASCTSGCQAEVCCEFCLEGGVDMCVVTPGTDGTGTTTPN